MSSQLTSLEAYDLLRHSELFEERLAQAEVAQVSRTGLEREKAWLSEALALVRAARPPVASILERARDLPELAEVREDYSFEVQGQWVDALERLHAGITFHVSGRAPIIETLFPHLKFPALRKASADAVRAYATEFERRGRMGYVKRMLATEEFAFALPVLAEIPAALARWESCFQPSTMPEEVAAPLRLELAEVAYRVDRILRQARLLSEAALLPVPEAFEESGLGRGPRRRVGTVLTEAPVSEEGAIVDDGVSLYEALGIAGGEAPAVEEAAAVVEEAAEATVVEDAPAEEVAAAGAESGVAEGTVVEDAPAEVVAEAAVVEEPAVVDAAGDTQAQPVTDAPLTPALSQRERGGRKKKAKAAGSRQKRTE